MGAYVISPVKTSETPLSMSSYRGSGSSDSKLIKDYSIVKAGDVIRPAFLHHVAGDPDLTGLQVYMEDAEGNRVNEPVHYSLPGKNAEGISGVLVPVHDLNEGLTDFSIPEGLNAGQYTLFFNVLGGSNILYQSRQALYYISDSDFSVGGLRTYMPGVSDGPQLIPPGTTILLEAPIISGKELDPYVVWYNGDRKIGEGKLSEHYHHLLWTVPEINGMQTMKVEVFPFLAGNMPAANTRGIVKEMSLPVSDKASFPRSFGDAGGGALYWDQFAGNVNPAEKALKNNAVLVKTQESPPRWAPLSSVYGLVIGEDDIYRIPDFSAALNTESNTEYDFYALHIRFAPKNEGTLFQGQFKTAGSDLLSLNLAVLLEKDGIVFHIQNGQNMYTEIIPVDLFAAEDFLTASLNFYSFKNKFSAFLELQNPPSSTQEVSISYGGTLSGGGTFSFGAKRSSAEEPVTDENVPDTKSPDIAIIDEFFLEHIRKTADI